MPPLAMKSQIEWTWAADVPAVPSDDTWARMTGPSVIQRFMPRS